MFWSKTSLLQSHNKPTDMEKGLKLENMDKKASILKARKVGNMHKVSSQQLKMFVDHEESSKWKVRA